MTFEPRVPGDQKSEDLRNSSGYLPGAASLLQELDKKLMVLLRDGKTLIGYLRSIDQFANLVLHRTIERIHVGKQYGDINRGVVVVRGENVVLLGEIDGSRESSSGLQQVPVNEILEAQRIDQETRQEQEHARSQALKKRGLPLTLDTTQEDF